MGVTSASPNVATTNSPAVDSFGRLRTSEVGNRMDIEFIYNGQEDIADEVVGDAGTVTHNANARHNVLAVVGTTTTANAAIYTYDVPYTPGNSQLIALTSALDFAGLGSGTAQIFVRTSISGSAVTTAIDQADWVDPVSDIDWTKTQIFEMDFQSLKVGRIRFYLNRNGQTTQVHEIFNDNIRNTGYWQVPSHPVYWRIYNDATYTYMEVGYGDTNNAIGFRYYIAKNASATMTAICATVKSEGGKDLFDMPGFNRSADRGVTKKVISTTVVPLISIKPNTTLNSLPNKSLVVPIDYSVETDNPIRLVVFHNPTLTGASWTAVDATESVMLYDVTAGTVTAGHILSSDYVATSRNANTSTNNLMGRALLWLRRGTETGILTLAAVRTGSVDANVLASIRWREIR